MNADSILQNPPLRQLTAQEFIDIVSEADRERYSECYEMDQFSQESITIKDVEIIEYVEIGNEISDIEIKLPVLIQNVSFSKGITINGGRFIRSIQIKDSATSSFVIGGGIFDKIDVRGGTFGFTMVRGGVFNRSLTIEDSTFNGVFRIDPNSTFIEDFIIKSGVFNAGFEVNGGSFEGVFSIQGGKFIHGFSICKGTFNNSFGIDRATFDSNFFVSDGVFNGEVSINGTTFNDEFSIEGGTFKKEVIFRSGYIYRFKIWDLAGAIRLRIEDRCRVNSLQLRSIIPKDSFIQLSGQFYSLSFNHVLNLGTIVITKLSAREVPLFPSGKKPIIEKDNPFEMARLSTYQDQTERAQIRIDNSDLGKVIFMGCDLSGFGLHFDSSKIIDVFVTGTKMPREIITPDLSQKQLGYSQIKKIYETRGDRIEANRYYAKEMEAYQHTLSWQKWQDLGEKINITANKISTNYGQSWVLGLAMTLLVSAFFYILYCDALGYQNAKITCNSKHLFWETCFYFPEFLNPIHKPDYIAQELLKINDKTHEAVPSWARLVETTSRIFIAYFVYQLIQAFRKHGKASG